MGANQKTSRQMNTQATPETSQQEKLDALAVFQQAALELKKIGVLVQVANGSEHKALVVLNGVHYCARCRSFRFFEEMSEKADVCQHCALNTTEAGGARSERANPEYLPRH